MIGNRLTAESTWCSSGMVGAIDVACCTGLRGVSSATANFAIIGLYSIWISPSLFCWITVEKNATSVESF